MKIALVTAYFYPIGNGGTEKYVLSLAQKLIAENHEIEIITVGETETIDYIHEGVKVSCLPDELKRQSEVISGNKAADNLQAFTKKLKEANYDLVHFHTLTPAFGIFHIEAAKRSAKKIYFTAHIPSITCIHGDLMQFGQKACDGLVMKNRCTACYISKKGLNKPLSKILAATINILGRPKTIAAVVTHKLKDMKSLSALCDKIFIFTNWQKEFFLKNGFNEKKLEMTTQFLGTELIPQQKTSKKIINIGFVGRITEEKGLHILINAFNALAKTELKLHIAGISLNDDYFRSVRKLAEKNQNIIWQLNINSQQIQDFYTAIDLLVIPSITYETGPFVLYEAIEVNLPIIANDLGDLKVWKSKGFDIELYDSPKELSEKLLAL